MGPPKAFILSSEVVSQGDLMRLERELNALDDFLIGAKARGAANAADLPRTSKLLDKVASDNGCNLLDDASRQAFIAALAGLEKQAPVIHFSFAAEPTPGTLQPLINWLRQNIHPNVFLSVGYQPRIAAGCIVRTPNKIFDLSMGAHLQKQAPLLMKLLREGANGS